MYPFPDDIIAHILSFVESVPIDTKLYFGVLPQQLIVHNTFLGVLSEMCSRRIALYHKMYDKQLPNSPLMLEFISKKLGNKDFCIDYRDYNGSIGYRITKLPSRLYFAVSIYEAVDFPCNLCYMSGPYSIHTGLLLDEM